MSEYNFEQFIAETKQAEAKYRPSQETLKQINSKTFVMLVGPTQSGKTTLARRAAEIDRTIHYVPTTTTRNPRHGDEPGTMRYVSHDSDSLRALSADIEAGNYCSSLSIQRKTIFMRLIQKITQAITTYYQLSRLQSTT